MFGGGGAVTGVIMDEIREKVEDENKELEDLLDADQQVAERDHLDDMSSEEQGIKAQAAPHRDFDEKEEEKMVNLESFQQEKSVTQAQSVRMVRVQCVADISEKPTDDMLANALRVLSELSGIPLRQGPSGRGACDGRGCEAGGEC